MNERSDILAVLDLFEARYEIQWGGGWGQEVLVFCPFCEDADSRRPAGRANVAKNVYYCHACGTGGGPASLLDQFITLEAS